MTKKKERVDSISKETNNSKKMKIGINDNNNNEIEIPNLDINYNSDLDYDNYNDNDDKLDVNVNVDDPNIDNYSEINIENDQQSIKRDIYVKKENLLDKIGVLDPEGLNNNPLTNEPYQNLYDKTYQEQSKFWTNLPIYSVREKAITDIYENQVILVISGTGSGKTVLTPRYVLHALNYQGKIAITNPKILPSGENAQFASQNMDVVIGNQVGLKHRGSDAKLYSNNSKLIYCTDGFLLAILKRDPELKDYDCVIIDEAHERGINIDLLLLQLKKIVLIRPEFKLIIMSATINSEIFINYFPINKFKFSILEGGAQSHKKIDEFFLNDIPFLNTKNIYNTSGKKSIIQSNGELKIQDDLYLDPIIEILMYLITDNHEGDILVFVGGKGTAAKGVELLKKKLNNLDPNITETIFIIALSSGVIDKKTKKLITDEYLYKQENPQFNRKVIFSTEVAESSITINGLVFVIDSGIVHSSRYYAESNLTSLEKRFIAKSSHAQRKGRVGRTQPGICYNLFTKEQYETLFDKFTTSPIYLDNISQFVLNFSVNKVKYIELPFKYPDYNKNENSILYTTDEKKEYGLSEFLYELIEPPKETAVNIILKRLQTLDCFYIKDNKNYVTLTARAISYLDIEPLLGKMLISAYNYNCRDQIADFLAFYELTEGKFNKIFLDVDNLKNKIIKQSDNKENNEKEIKKLQKKYQTAINKFISPYGDIISFINLFQEFKNKKYQKKIDGDTRPDDDTPSDDDTRPEEDIYSTEILDKWLSDNFLSKKKLVEIEKNSKREYIQKFKKFLDFEKKKNVKKNISNIFINKDFPPIIDKNNNINLLNAILDSLLINMCKIFKTDSYYPCLPLCPQEGKLPDNRTDLKSFVSLPEFNRKITSYNLNKNFITYLDFISIFTNKTFNLVTIIPIDYLKNIIIQKQNSPDNIILNTKYEIINECFLIDEKLKEAELEEKKNKISTDTTQPITKKQKSKKNKTITDTTKTNSKKQKSKKNKTTTDTTKNNSKKQQSKKIKTTTNTTQSITKKQQPKKKTTINKTKSDAKKKQSKKNKGNKPNRKTTTGGKI